MQDTGKIKRVYFVRHGNTAANVSGTVQLPSQELNETGLLQAEKIADRVKNLTIDTLIASNFTRAIQTAAVIAERTGLKYESSELFHEAVTPTSLHGLSRVTNEYQSYIQAVQDNLDDSNWHYEDEENFHDLCARSKKAIEHIEKHEGSDILVVTHGHFLRYLFSHAMLRDTLEPSARRALHNKLEHSNVGLSMFTVMESEWQLVIWNDHAHLAE